MMKMCRRAVCSSITSSPQRLLFCITVLVVTCCVSILVIPVRNVVFQYYMRKAWRDVSTMEIFSMHYLSISYPPGIYAKVTCDVTRKPAFRREDINQSRVHVHRVSYDTNLIHDALAKGHGRYLPVLKKDTKLDYFYLFQTMRDALDERNIPFFMTDGSILGTMRHGGFIPWDDDLDFAIHVGHWEDVKQVLGCIEGFNLRVIGPHHWKFLFDGSDFPFLDIFFYSKYGSNLWALTSYLSHTFVYPEDMVFPLVEVDFEGMKMPMPGQGLKIAQRIFDFSICVVDAHHVIFKMPFTDVYPDGYSKNSIPCRELLYLYPMYNLDSEEEKGSSWCE